MHTLILCCDRRYKVEAEEGLDHIVVVDGVPIVDKSKLEKLVAKISKEFGKRGAHIKPDNIFVPWDDAKDKSKGCVRYSITNSRSIEFSLYAAMFSWNSRRLKMPHTQLLQ
jgi:translation initiation factor 3 subunit B